MKRIIVLLFFILAQDGITQEAKEGQISSDVLLLLGEQSHWVKSFYEEKKKIIRQATEDSKAEVLLLIESPLVLSIVSVLKGDSSNYHYHHTNTKANIDFFSSYVNYGMDLQEDCRFGEFGSFLIQRGWCDQNDQELLRMDSLLGLCILGKNYSKDVLTKQEGRVLKESISKLKSKVLLRVQKEEEAEWLEICFTSRLQLAEYLQLSIKNGRRDRIRYRDSIMALNVKQLLDRHKGYLGIVWAANLHIGRKGVMGSQWTNAQVKSMAEYLEKDYELYRVAVDSKRRRKEEDYFDEIRVVSQRVLVDPKYLILNCD